MKMSDEVDSPATELRRGGDNVRERQSQ